MSIHLGIDPYEGKLSYYDEVEKMTKSMDITIIKGGEVDTSIKIKSMFEQITSKIKGTFGNACIYLNYGYQNEIRKEFISTASKFGIQNIEMINEKTGFYIRTMSQIDYKPSNENVIWIDRDDGFYVWKIDDKKARFIGFWEAIFSSSISFEKIIKESKLDKGPDIVIHKKNRTNYGTILKKLPNCKLFSYVPDNYNNFSKESLLKAQITAGDDDLAHLDIENALEKDISLRILGNEFASLKWGQRLPITYVRKIARGQATYGPEPIQIVSGHCGSSIFVDLPNYDPIFFTFKIDENEMYHVTISELPNDEALIHWDKNATSEAMKDVLKSPFLQPSALTTVKFYKIPTVSSTSNAKISAVGIDLGTSRCCVAVNRKNYMATVPLDNTGERLLPSYVAYDEKTVICGRVAVNRLRNYSKSIIFDSKRIIGRNINEVEIDSNWAFNISHNNSKVMMEIKKCNVTVEICAEEVAADLLRYMRRKTEEFQGRKLSQVVITVPAAFNENQKIATIEAAKLAGWNEIILLPEPIAAAFAYFIDRPILNNSSVLLFDLGGGTLDVCIFKITEGKIQVISNTGDSKLGGRDFDNVLFNHFKNQIGTKYGISLVKDKKYKLLFECQRIKEDLSTVESCCFNVDEFDPMSHESIFVTRNEFQIITKPLLNRIKNTLHSALHDSKYKENEIKTILLVGGGSRMPMIKQLLQETFPSAEHCCEEHPDEVVAIGAAYYAYSILS